MNMADHFLIGGKKFVLIKAGATAAGASSTPIIRFKDKKSWTAHQTFELIRLYKQNQNLYDTTHVGYMNRSARKEAYRNISQGLAIIRPNTTEEEIRIKWNSLRTHFIREYSKVCASKTLNDDGEAQFNYKPTMLYYDAMLFVKDTKEGKNSADLSDSEVPDASSSDQKLDQDKAENATKNEESLEKETPDTKEKIVAVPVETNNASESPPAKKAKERKSNEVYKLLIDTNFINSATNNRSTVLPRPILPNTPIVTHNIAPKQVNPLEGKPYDGFCQYIGETLRSLPLSQARKLEQRLLTTLITFMSNNNSETIYVE